MPDLNKVDIYFNSIFDTTLMEFLDHCILQKIGTLRLQYNGEKPDYVDSELLAHRLRNVLANVSKVVLFHSLSFNTSQDFSTYVQNSRNIETVYFLGPIFADTLCDFDSNLEYKIKTIDTNMWYDGEWYEETEKIDRMQNVVEAIKNSNLSFSLKNFGINENDGFKKKDTQKKFSDLGLDTVQVKINIPLKL